MKTSRQFNSYPDNNNPTDHADRGSNTSRALEIVKNYPMATTALGALAASGVAITGINSLNTAPQPTAMETIESESFEELGTGGIAQLQEAKAIIRSGTDGVPRIDFIVNEGSTLVDAATAAIKSQSADSAKMSVLQNEEVIYTAQELNEELGNVTPAGYEATVYVADFVDNDGKLDFIVDRRPAANE